MAAGNATLFTPAILSLGAGGFLLATDTFQCILATNSYTPAPNTDALYSDVSAFEVATGGGYTLGGLTLTGQSWTRNGATCSFSAQSVLWSGATFAARYAVLVRRASLALAPTDKLLCYADLTGGGNGAATASIFQVNWNNASTPSSANTVFTITHNP